MLRVRRRDEDALEDEDAIAFACLTTLSASLTFSCVTSRCASTGATNARFLATSTLLAAFLIDFAAFILWQRVGGRGYSRLTTAHVVDNLDCCVPVCLESVCPLLLNLTHSLHCTQRGAHEVTIEACRDVTLLLKLKGRVLCGKNGRGDQKGVSVTCLVVVWRVVVQCQQRGGGGRGGV